MVEARLQVFRTFFSPVLIHLIDPLQQLGGAKGAFLNASAHLLLPPYFALRCLTMNFSVRFFVLRVL